MTIVLKIVDPEHDVTIFEEMLMLCAAESHLIVKAITSMEVNAGDLCNDARFALNFEASKGNPTSVRINGDTITRASADKLLGTIDRLLPYISNAKFRFHVLSLETRH